MTVKEKVLSALTAGGREYISGEALARTLGVSRTAVWKAIDALRRDYAVEAVAGQGYRLAPDCDVLTGEGVAAALKNKALRVETFQSVTSTNTVLRERAAAGESEGLVLLASEQTAGRGRGRKGFFSPAGTGLYMSLLLRPALEASKGALITTAAAVAVAQAIETVCGARADIKWVNDVFVAGKKVCGILTEAQLSMENGGLDYAVLGIGVNVTAPKGGFPPEITDCAGALFPAGGAPMGTRSRLAAKILDCFSALYEDLASPQIFEEYRRRLFILGKTVAVLRDGAERCAVVTGLDRDFNLRVRYENGAQDTLASGEISLKV